MVNSYILAIFQGNWAILAAYVWDIETTMVQFATVNHPWVGDGDTTNLLNNIVFC